MNDGVFVHANGLCESESVGSGTRIWAFAHVRPGAVIGADCNVCDGVFIEGDVTLGDRVTVKNGVMMFAGVSVADDAFLGPGVIFANDPYPRSRLREGEDHLQRTSVGWGASLGANSTVVPGISIGDWSMIGAGSLVTKDIPTHGFALGSPARRIGWACRCGERLGQDLGCRSCGRAYEADGDSIAEIES